MVCGISESDALHRLHQQTRIPFREPALAVKPAPFIRQPESFDSEDLDDAVQYVEDAFGREVDSDGLRFKSVIEMDPSDFVIDASHLKDDPGWLLKFPESEWEAELKDAYDRPFDHIIRNWKAGVLSPGIQIDGDFGDGAGRSSFYHAIGQQIPVAQFESAGHEKTGRRDG